MDEERDFVVFTDEDGNEFELDVIGYFDYKDSEYAILADCGGCAECEEENCEECDEDEGGLYIMRIIVSEDGETEEFVPPEDAEMDDLIAYAEQILEEDDCCCGCGDECDCEDGDCGCGEHEHDCHCGCHDKE